MGSGGTFKLCFCDSVLNGAPCRTEADYSVEVGTIHASGVSCLVSKPNLQRVACTDQMWGGLRCYSHLATPPKPTPPLLSDMTIATILAEEQQQQGDQATTQGDFCAEEGGCQTEEQAQNAS